jgi:enoyl-CoA hydratase
MHEAVKFVINNSGVLQITLNRPSALNALNIEVMTQLQDIFIAAKSNYAVKGLLITGEGKAFCAGADINQLNTLNAQAGLEFSRHGQKVFRLLEQLGKPSIAAINGFALGGGCELAMAATLRIASTQAVFGQPEIKLGIIPGFGGTQRLSRLVGKGRALDLCLTGRTINASDALQWGLVSEVVPPDELLNKTESILNHLTKLAPLALKSMMNVIDYGYDISLEEALEFEATHFGLCCSTRDKEEGVKAFLEKRSAEFVGE